MARQQILVYLIGSLGDTLVTVPSLWVLRENFPSAKITVLTDQQSGKALVQTNDILNGSGLIDDCITYPARSSLAMIQLLKKLRSIKFDTLVYLITTYANDSRIQRDEFYFRLAGIKQFIGMQGFNKKTKYSLGSILPVETKIAETLLARLRASGLKTPAVGQGRFDVNIGDYEQENIKRWSSGLPTDGSRPWIAVALGSKMSCKIWPLERYIAVAKQLICEFDLWPIVFGGAGETGLGQRFIKEVGRGYIAAGTLGVRDSMAAMKRCVLFVGNDTGTMHMAAASGVRCVVPFSSRDIRGRWYPYGKGHMVFRTTIDCQGCMLEECIERKKECILSISGQQIIDACRAVLIEQGIKHGK